MALLIELDGGSAADGGGQLLRSALALSAASGRGFELKHVRAGSLRSGLRPHDVAAVRAMAMACGARVGGIFDGSTDLRFEPGVLAGGSFEIEAPAAAAMGPVLEMLLPVLVGAEGRESSVAIKGGTHVPGYASFHYVARHWATVTSRLGLNACFDLDRLGFWPRGDGVARLRVSPRASGESLDWGARGALLGISGLAVSGRLKNEAAARQAEAARRLFWERLRLESAWETLDLPATAPGMFVQVMARFERGQAAFSCVGGKGQNPEINGERCARRLLRFLDQEEGSVDPFLCDQIIVPLLLARTGGQVTTSHLTAQVSVVAAVAAKFGLGVRIWGETGTAGGLAVEAG